MWIVTGGTGFIGSALIWDLNQRGLHDIWVVDHVSPQERPGLLSKRHYKKFSFAQDFLKEAQEFSDVHGVYHMGACSSTTETNEDYLNKNNTEYSQDIFRLCTEKKWPLVYASSGACYGNGALGFDDTKPTSIYSPLNLYGWSKVKMDIWAEAETRTPPNWYGLRFFNVYGPNEYFKGEMSSVVFKAFKQIQDSGTLRLFRSHDSRYRDGEQLRDFVYVKDITRWMIELMTKSQTAQRAKSGIYNLGYGQARTWLDLAHATFQAMDKKVQIDWIDVPVNIRNQYQYFTEARIEKLLAQGISKPLWPLERGVNDYLSQHLLKNDPFL